MAGTRCLTCVRRNLKVWGLGLGIQFGVLELWAGMISENDGFGVHSNDGFHEPINSLYHPRISLGSFGL